VTARAEVLASVLAERLPEYLAEWRRTCKSVGIKCTDKDAAIFAAEGLAHQLAAALAAEEGDQS
jgi:hypothetical protein